jgi:protein-tyrosine-phosphatase
MAEALLNTLNEDKYEGYSAGVIATRVNPHVVKAMLK